MEANYAEDQFLYLQILYSASVFISNWNQSVPEFN